MRKINIITFFCITLLIIIGCEREEAIPPRTPTPIQQLETFTTQHTEEGVLKWTLVGNSSEMQKTKVGANKIIVQNPKVQIFEEGKVSITLTSQTGELYNTGKKKNNVYLQGNVVGVNDNGTLHTELLEWQNKIGTLYAPNEVKLIRGDSTWNGKEMVANPNLETVTMKNNRFRLYPKDEEINEK